MIGKLLYCSVELEHKVASLYRELASLVEGKDKITSLILKQIGLESDVHSEVFRSLSIMLGLYEETGDCPVMIGEAWRRVEEAHSKIKQGGVAEAKSVLKELVVLEGFVGEETYHKLLLPLLLKLLQDKEAVNLTRLLIEKIIQDEAYHEEAVKKIIV
uniref:Ferritin-like domain-containing protein n=1 Tax=Thermosphaera aggregans TaxID=54254 RepID=A0A7C2BKT4_9CREN